MSDKYTKADLRHIAEYMIDDLRECEDGTKTTTAELVMNQGYDGMGTDDLQVLHKELLRTAKANKITLDMSENEGKEEGLPFSREFVVKNKRAQIKCPYCGRKIPQDIFMVILHSLKRCKRIWTTGNGH